MGFVSALESISKVNGDLFVVELSPELEILFRLPTYRQATQYRLILELSSNNIVLDGLIYEHIFRTCTEEKYLAKQDLPAGVPETIAKTILFLSGVGEQSMEYTEELFELYRGQSDTTSQYMKRFICATFSGYTFKDLEELNYQELINIFIQAEKLSLDRRIIDKEHDFKDPNEKKPRVPTIGEMIGQDTSDYRRFDTAGQQGRPPGHPDPAERAQREEAAYRQAMADRQK